jgi:cytosine deaminase
VVRGGCGREVWRRTGCARFVLECGGGNDFMGATIRGAGWRRLGGALTAAYGALDSGSTIAAVPELDHNAMLELALAEARAGSEEGGVPIGSAMFDASGALLGRGHNQRVQRDDPSAHAETEAFRNAGRRRSYRDTTISTTLAPCWYCSGLIRQFGIGTVVVGESRTFQGGIEWLRECGVEVIDLDSQECVDLLQAFIARAPEIWDEDIGE